MSDGNREDACEAPADENREEGKEKAFMSLFVPRFQNELQSRAARAGEY